MPVKRSAAIMLFAVLLCGQTRQPAPANEAAWNNLPAQRIGANDLVAVSVYDAPEFTRTVRIGADGSLRLPMLKRPIEAGGKLPSELESAIAAALSGEQILVDPVVTVTVVEYASRPISVTGAVRTPTTFQALGRVTLLEAVTRAGGLSPDAGSQILVTAPEAGPDGTPLTVTRRIATRDLIDAADPGVNLALHGGEEIRVPEAGKVFVVGNVKKPGAYPVEDNTDSSVLKMLAMAEGLAPYASKKAYIIRRDDRTGAKKEIPIELGRILARKSPDVPLAAQDVLYIPDNTGRRASMTALEKAAGFGAATLSGLLIWRR
jgi:polysaccharide export outer membrane protein